MLITGKPLSTGRPWNPVMPEQGPLAGVVVLDLSVWGLGPIATVALADLGAEHNMLGARGTSGA